MSKVLTCIDYDSTTQTCLAEQWVDQASIVDYFPTVLEANAVGGVFLSSLFLIAFVAKAFNPKE